MVRILVIYEYVWLEVWLFMNKPEPSQIENAKQKVRLNSNQRAIQPLANICWNPISAHATILIRGLKS